MSIPLAVSASGMKERNARVYIDKIGGPVNELLDNARDALARFKIPVVEAASSTKVRSNGFKFLPGKVNLLIGKFFNSF